MHLSKAVKRYVLTFNVFHRLFHSSREEENIIRLQIIATRVYLITLISLLFVLVLYTSQVPVIQSIIIDSPLYNEYVDLYNNHSQSLSCPCKNINIPQQQFLQIGVRFHQVCYSDFISELYSLYLSQVINYGNLTIIDTGKANLQMIASWCRLANSSVVDDRAAFYAEEFTTYEVLSRELFDNQVKSLTSLFSESTKDLFVRSLATIQQTTETNILASGYQTNVLVYTTGRLENATLHIGYEYYPASRACICVLLNNCTQPISESRTSDGRYIPVPILTGFLRGCYVHEATLQSTLECYYNQSCLDLTHSYFGLSLPANFTALDSMIPSQFNTTSDIRSIIAHMMVEEWIYTSSHTSFYNACQPLYCSYSYVGKNDLSVTINNIVGLIGGLTTILMVIIPQIVQFVRGYRWHLIIQSTYSDGSIYILNVYIRDIAKKKIPILLIKNQFNTK